MGRSLVLYTGGNRSPRLPRLRRLLIRAVRRGTRPGSLFGDRAPHE